MSEATLGVDAYQLTTLLAHADEGRLGHRLTLAFFSRQLPPQRNYVVFAGLRQVLDHAARLRFEPSELAALAAHPLLGPALAARPAVREALLELDGFVGSIDALAEGTLAFAGPARRTDGTLLQVAGAPLALYTPLLQVKTDLLRAKLIETPWLGYVNHLSMVASKTARMVDAAGGKPVLEFGARRTHPAAALDASYAAHLAGAAATSNLAAFAKYGVPAAGTMDHFAVQASERPGVPVGETEAGFFAAFARAFPDAATMLVDTYETERGIANAVRAGGLTGIRLDSQVSVEGVRRARALLVRLGAGHVKIFVSDSLDERRVQELAPVVDGFGVGENITCSPDSPVGVGAVAKLVVNGYGKVTMKLAHGSGKATLPGELQVHRFGDHDLVALADEETPSGGTSLLRPVWRGDKPCAEPAPLAVSRAYVRRQLDQLPPAVRALAPTPAEEQWPLVASDALVRRIEETAAAAR